ncbi:MAG TPA: HAMP domain-containing sensor histidine kinase [Acidobacteriota bacterium]|nr:HAMP domain-containing sensor histidine kinase [Acidobacteriota bacterium]
MDRRLLFVRWGFAALLVISVAQLGWWILDQVWFTGDVRMELLRLHQERLAMADALLEAGVPGAEVERLIDDVRVRDGVAELDETVLPSLEAQRRSRLNRYLWEGAFFLVVLLAALSMIARVLRQEARLRRRQDNLLAAVSHEFKSPLAAARVAADTLALRSLDHEGRQRHVQRVLGSLERLQAMVDNLLESARIEEGAMTFYPSQLAVKIALDPLLSDFVERAAARGIAFDVEVPDSLTIFADETALRTVVRNLLENAFEAVRDAGDDPAVTFSASQEVGEVLVEVADNGRGFDPSATERLFDKFYRPGDEMRRSGRGVGLGLHIARTLMISSGGRIQGSSAGPGHGAQFRTYWPPTAKV